MPYTEPGTFIKWTVEFFVPGVTDPMVAYEKMKELRLIPPDGVYVGDKRAKCKVVENGPPVPTQQTAECRQTEMISSDTSPSPQPLVLDEQGESSLPPVACLSPSCTPGGEDEVR